MTRITYRQFLLASALGNGPVLVVLAFLGDGLAAPDSPQFWIAVGLYAVALLAAPAIALIRRGLGKPPLLERPHEAAEARLPEEGVDSPPRQ